MTAKIGRFYQKSLGQYFSRVSGLVYDSGTQPEWRRFLPNSRRWSGRGLLKPKPALRVKVVYRSDPDALRAV